VQTFTKDKSFTLDLSDDIQKGSIITRDGDILHSRTKDALQTAVGGER
jgi:hypothetical protein